ncbi:hypothetical protein E1262_08955 [Jiangella aurantiaca]|uniref:MFS transporter n=1 Tax=Jiangella aurantiaca TaxID=2530373 RepID=A0A4R5AIG4_9ACTN|nr:hypothetical protein [Jiangella aurantiaca]TDD70764.1 hypothetical protein E1262_08955 [Jiangella aurantiaca]
MSTPTSPGEGAPTDALGRALRLVSFAMLGGVVAIAAVAVFTVGDEAGSGVDAFGAILVSVVFVAAALFVPRRLVRPWPATAAPNEVKAAGQLRSAAFLSLVFAELPTLIGLVNSFARGVWLPVAIGALFSVAGLLLTAPTADRLREWLARMESAGARTGL